MASWKDRIFDRILKEAFTKRLSAYKQSNPKKKITLKHFDVSYFVKKIRHLITCYIGQGMSYKF